MTYFFIKWDPNVRMSMATKYVFKFNLEGGKSLEIELEKDRFEKLSELCEKEFPDKEWKLDKIRAIEAE